MVQASGGADDIVSLWVCTRGADLETSDKNRLILVEFATKVVAYDCLVAVQGRVVVFTKPKATFCREAVHGSAGAVLREGWSTWCDGWFYTTELHETTVEQMDDKTWLMVNGGVEVVWEDAEGDDSMETSGSEVTQIQIGNDCHGFRYQRVPRDAMQMADLELWIGKRGYYPHRQSSHKLVLVKHGDGQVIAWDMKVIAYQSLDGKWSHARWFGDGQKKWQFDPGSSPKDPLTPGKYQWKDLTWEGKGWYKTTVVGPEAREEAKRRRVETECIVVPQKVVVTNVVKLEFIIFWS